MDAQARVDEYKLAKALEGNDETSTQFRNVVTAGGNIVERYKQRVAALAETGSYTDKGLAEAAKPIAEEMLAEIAALRQEQVTPKRERWQAESAALPPPSLEKLSEFEQHRYISTYTSAHGNERTRMKGEALRNPKLAAALIAEDPVVTGLTEEYINQLREIHGKDEHAAQRHTLRENLSAVQGVDSYLEGAESFVRRTLEIAQ